MDIPVNILLLHTFLKRLRENNIYSMNSDNTKKISVETKAARCTPVHTLSWEPFLLVEAIVW